MATKRIHYLQKRAAWAGVAVASCLILLIGWGEYSSWSLEMSSVERETSNLAVSFVQHADDVVEATYTPLASLIAAVEFDGVDQRGLQRLDVLMDALKAQNPNILDLFVYNADGSWLATSATEPGPSVNNADREYFKAHRASESLEPRIGDPIVSRSTGEWIIPVTRRFNAPDGSFGGVVLASLRSRYFSEFFLSFDTGKNGSAILVRDDGIVLARSPVDEKLLGTNISTSVLFTQHLKYADKGAYHYTSPVDGVQRIGGYFRDPKTHLVVLTAVSQWEALDAWINGAVPRWSILAVVLTGSVILALFLLRHMRRQLETDRLLALREAEFRILTQHSHDLVERIDPNGIRRYVSPASINVLGKAPEALVGTNAFDTVDPDHQTGLRAAVQRLKDGSRSETVEFQTTFGERPGQWLETTLSVLPGNPEDLSGVVAVTRDISARKKAELQLAEMAAVDWLTNLANRRAFDERFATEVKRATRAQAALSLILIDADRFKAFNDTYGHLAGDECLRSIARAVSGSARRPGDLIARYGGEEIVMLLPNTDLSGAIEVAERARTAVEQLALVHEKNVPFGCVTISAGVATFEPSDKTSSADQLLAIADWALYRAKENGRNQIASVSDRMFSIEAPASDNGTGASASA